MCLPGSLHNGCSCVDGDTLAELAVELFSSASSIPRLLFSSSINGVLCICVFGGYLGMLMKGEYCDSAYITPEPPYWTASPKSEFTLTIKAQQL